MYDLERELIAELPARYETDTVTINFGGATVANSANVTQGNLALQGGGHSTQMNWSNIYQKLNLSVDVYQD
jgi:hypothetical protein